MLAAELLVAADDAGQIRLHQLATEVPACGFTCVSMPLFVYLPCFPSVHSITHDTHERTTQGLGVNRGNRTPKHAQKQDELTRCQSFDCSAIVPGPTT